MGVVNSVRIEGAVKRSEKATVVRNGVEVMSFCLVVPDAIAGGRDVYVDCFAATKGCDDLGGYVSEGELVAVSGHLAFRTMTDSLGRKRSGLIVYVDDAWLVEDSESAARGEAGRRVA